MPGRIDVLLRGSVLSNTITPGVVLGVGSTPSPWMYGLIRPDQPDMAGVPVGFTPTPISTGNIAVGDSGPSGPAGGVPFTGSGLTKADPFLIQGIQTDGTIAVATAKYVKFLNCDLQCTTFGSTDGGVVNTASALVPHLPDQVTIERCDIHQLAASWLLDGIYGHGWTSIRNHIYHVQDGFGSLCTVSAGVPNAYNKDYGSHVEKLIYYQGRDQFGANSNPGGNDDATAVLIDGSHADGVQIQGGSFHSFFGTYLNVGFDNTTVSGVKPWMRKTKNDTSSAGNGHSYYGTLNANSPVQINQNQGTSFPVNDVWFDKCWFDGGRPQVVNWTAVNYVEGGSMQYDRHKVSNCRWGRRSGWTSGYWVSGDAAQSTSPGYPINSPSGSNLYTRITWVNNVFEDTNDPIGDPVPIRRASSTIIGYAT